MSNQEDALLVAGCKKQDRSAMERLYLKYTPRMLAVSLRYCSDKMQAEDVVQDAFIKIFKSMKNYQHQGYLKSWIERIVVNTAIDHYKKSKKTIYLNSKDQEYISELDYEENQEKTFDQNVAVDKIRKLIVDLPEQYRYVLNLYAVEGYNHKEIADMLNIKESTSRSNYTRARKKLLEAIQNSKQTYKS